MFSDNSQIIYLFYAHRASFQSENSCSDSVPSGSIDSSDSSGSPASPDSSNSSHFSDSSGSSASSDSSASSGSSASSDLSAASDLSASSGSSASSDSSSSSSSRTSAGGSLPSLLLPFGNCLPAERSTTALCLLLPSPPLNGPSWTAAGLFLTGGFLVFLDLPTLPFSSCFFSNCVDF